MVTRDDRGKISDFVGEGGQTKTLGQGGHDGERSTSCMRLLLHLLVVGCSSSLAASTMKKQTHGSTYMQ